MQLTLNVHFIIGMTKIYTDFMPRTSIYIYAN